MTQADTSPRPSKKAQRDAMLRRFTGHVQELVEDPAVRRALRPAARYSLDDERTEAARWELLHWIHNRTDEPELTRSRNIRSAMFLTAGLIAQCPTARTLEERWHEHARSADRDPQPPYGLRFDLGLALAELERRTREDGEGRRQAEPGAGRLTPLRKRLVQAVRAEPEDLPLLMSRTISYLHSQQACVPAWWTLASDLVEHAYRPGAVGMHWQESFLRLPEWRRPAPFDTDPS
ncbi:hypothetical protein AB0I72_26560 [Nocardiopsis sp. NPDC049922]|uniref:type I-E CRISPR-associated protein Cse2/CasB n=1 Tax=Nocardiopsis sp. NPDC049922 TaxID=3155157 RepID=UPI0033F768E2